MKLIIFSDSHGLLHYMREIVSRSRDCTFLHLGDNVRDMETVMGEYPGSAVYQVSGNSYEDLYSGAQRERVVTVEGVRIFMAHGHRHDVRQGVSALRDAAATHAANLVLFGHTHVPYSECFGDVWVVNPGSISGIRSTVGVTYAEVVIEGGIVIPRIVGV